MNKVTKVCLYVVTSPLWIPGIALVTMLMLKSGVVTIDEIFERKNKRK